MIREALRPILGPSPKEMERFFSAAYFGKESQLETLLAAGDIDVEAWGPMGQHALYKAVISKSQPSLRVLLNHKADPNRMTEHGYAAIHEAAHTGQAGMICDLVDAGADVNLKTSSGAYAISYACARGHIEAALALAERGAKLGVLHSQAGESLLHQVAGVVTEHPGSGILAGLALDSGVPVNGYSERGLTPLLKAVEAKNATMVVLLLEANADPSLVGLQPKDAEGTRWHVGKTPEALAAAIKAEACEVVLRSWAAKHAARLAIDELGIPASTCGRDLKV